MSTNKKVKKIKSHLSPNQKERLKLWNEKVKDGTALETVKKICFESMKADCDPVVHLNDAAKNAIPNLSFLQKPLTDKERALLSTIVMDFGLENDLSIVEAVEERYRGMMINLRRGLIKEYECKSISELALVDMVVTAYSRNLSHSKMLTHYTVTASVSPNMSKFLSVLSQDIDRAQRHFVDALTTLRQMKGASLTVNVKARNAYIAQNQQFNAVEPSLDLNTKPTDNEIIE